MSKLIFVIGNGPSLRDFDFARLDGHATLGMNAAYRHWDRIGWYPTYYCCLDDQLIQTHHQEIKRLVEHEQVRGAFVHGSFFELHPECISDERFWSFDQFHSHWYRRRGQATGRLFIDSRAFKTRDSSKVTTGAYAVRFCAHLGYECIGLLGIDLKYVEILPEAERGEGIALRMAATPKHNPNYFFDDYQQAGDRYNIPNPDVHQGDLHLASFEVVRDDFVEHAVPTKIVNCNMQSGLHERAVFPFETVEKVAGIPLLGAVLVPCTAGEKNQILANFELWKQPAFAPFLGARGKRLPKLIVVFNKAPEETRDAIVRHFGACELHRFFSGIEVHSLDLDGESDSYNRSYKGKVGAEGYKAGPNNQFFRSMQIAESAGRYTFMMESDCVPIRPGWLGHLSDLVDGAEPFFIMGSAYRGVDTLSPSFSRHINGNAVYASGDPDFVAFMNDFWEPQLRGIVAGIDKRLAYDCILEMVFSSARSDVSADPSWRTWQANAHRLRFTNFIQNISGPTDLAQADFGVVAEIRRNSPETYVVHSQALAQIVREMRGVGSSSSDVPQAKRSGGAPETTVQTTSSLPCLLVFDLTAKGDGSATGEIKANLIGDWPAGSFLQFYSKGRDKIGSIGASPNGSEIAEENLSSIDAILDRFKPEIILYRPVPDTPLLHKAAMRTIARYAGLPLVTWIMDDWPSRLKTQDPLQFAALDEDWRMLLDRSALRLSIGSKMSQVFSDRYGYDFQPFANGVDPSEWPQGSARSKGEFLVRYAGALAEDMTARSIRRVAEAVERLAEAGTRIRLEIRTRPMWKVGQEIHYKTLRHTSFVTDSVPPKEYRRWLSEADAVLIGYNFDEVSLRYIGLSIANKMPECLASGAAVVALGPNEAATIEYLKSKDCALVIDREDDAVVEAAFKTLIDNPDMRSDLISRSRRIAFSDHDVGEIRNRFYSLLREASAVPSFNPDGRPAATAGTNHMEYSRGEGVDVDETGVVARILQQRHGRSYVMLDVGAHVGSSAAYFDALGWTIHCFEPDPVNRQRLTAKFGSSENVTIDPRAISDRPASGVPFFKSKESTGISGLHAFRDTHHEDGNVDVTTIAEIVEARGIEHVDFLKIDVEGFDFAVLKGVPWDRLQPDVVECEFEDAKTRSLGHTYEDVAQFLKDKGYAVYLSEWHPIIRYGISHDWRRIVPFPGEKLAPDAWGNILAFKKDPGLAALSIAFESVLKKPARPEPVAVPSNQATPGKTSNGGQPESNAPMPSLKTASSSSYRRIPAFYTRFALWAVDRNPLVFRAGQFAMWCLRTARRQKRSSAIGIAILLVLAGLSLAAPYAGLRLASGIVLLAAILASLLLAVVGFTGHLLKRSEAMVRAGIAAQLRRITAIERQSKELRAELMAKDRVAGERIAVLDRMIKEGPAAMTGGLAGLRNDIVAQREQHERLNSALSEANARIEAAETGLGSLRQGSDAANAMKSKIEATEAGLASLRQVSDAANVMKYQRFKRNLDNGDLEILQRDWMSPLALDLKAKHLSYLAHRATVLESLMKGRLATGIETIVLRTLVCFAVKRSDLAILEIGTLFGVGTAAIYEAASDRFQSVHLTVIDPLDGYYGTDRPDLLTGVKVSEANLRHNWEVARIPLEATTIIKDFSESAAAISAARERDYDILIIDGDHSRDGVKRDFENYFDMVRPGGFVLFDDYGVEEWPDIKSYVDEEIEGRADLAPVGKGFRTAVYRKVETGIP